MKFSNLTLDNAHLFLQDLQNKKHPIEKPEHKEFECDECYGEMVYINHFLTCSDCGLTDLDRCESYYLDDPETFLRKRSFYKRKLYVIEKLNLITCRKPCRKPSYLDSVKTLSKCKFKTIYELKKLMKNKKMSKLYPYIYLIYYDVKKIKLIELTCNQLDRIATEFVTTEMLFKSSSIKRKNMLSYYSLIYLTMKRLNYAGYKNIILPNNFKEMKVNHDNYLVVQE